jgi:hypothetical protein
LIRFGVAKDVDDLAMFGSAFWVYNIPKGVGLDRRYHMLTSRLPSRLLVDHSL